MGDLNDMRELQKSRRKSELLIIQQKLSLLRNKGKCRQKFLQSKNTSKKIKNVSNRHVYTAGSNATLATASLSIPSSDSASKGIRSKHDNSKFSTKRQVSVEDSDIDDEPNNGRTILRAPSVQNSRSRSKIKIRNRNTNHGSKQGFEKKIKDYDQSVRALSTRRSKSRSVTGIRNRDRNINDCVKHGLILVEGPLCVETVLQSKSPDTKIKVSLKKEKRLVNPKRERRFSWGGKRSDE